MNDGSTSVRHSGYCPHCSGAGNYVYHGGHCPQVRAKEYHPNGRVKRIEFLNHGNAEMNFDAPMELVDSMAREVVIEVPTLLEPGRYTVVLGELRKIVDDTPLGSEPLPDNAGALQRLVFRALQVPPSPDWERELDDL